MRKFLFAGALFATLVSFAQNPVTFDDVFRSKAFSAKGVWGLRSMEDGLHYSRQTAEGIEKFDFATGESQGVLVTKGAAKTPKGRHSPSVAIHGRQGNKNSSLRMK